MTQEPETEPTPMSYLVVLLAGAAFGVVLAVTMMAIAIFQVAR